MIATTDKAPRFRHAALPGPRHAARGARPASGRASRASGRAKRASAAFLAAFFAAALGARAAVVLTGEHKTLDGSQPPFTYTVALDGDKARMETSGSPGTAFIYRADKGVFWMLDSGRKTYSEMTRKDLEAMAASMDMAMQRMMEQLAQLPPDQRQAMEKMMRENMGGAGGPKPTYKKAGTGKVGSWACDKYDSFVEGKKKAEVCVVDPQLLGFSEADFKALKDMAKPFERFAKDIQTMLPQDSVPGAPKGAPVKSVLFEGGKPKAEAVIKEVKKEPIPAARFEVPAGYAKKAMSASDLGN